MGAKLSRPDQTIPSEELSKKRKKRNTVIRSVLSNSTKKKTTLNNNNIDNNNNEDTISRVTNTEAPKQTISGDTNNDDTCLNDPAATITTTKRSILYDPLKSNSRRSRRSRISSSSSSIHNRLSIHDENAPFYSKSNISSGWTALSNDPFSQIEVNTSTFTEITDHSTISRKSLYPEDTLFSSSTTIPVQRPSSSFLASSARDIQQQLQMYPSRSYQIIKEAFKKAQLQNDPYDWTQFYMAIDHYAIQSHDPVALVYLARCLISGLGCTPDIQRGFDLLKSHPSCETNYALGHCYLDGLPANGPHTIQDVDKATAFEYFLSAANDYEPTNESIATTIAEAQCRLARMLFQGEGVEQNSKEGFEYLMKSAENNNMYAQFLVGVHYERGLDIPQDLEKAMHYYQKSADQGFPDAQAALGNRLIVEENYKEGIQWLEKAVQMSCSPPTWYTL
ncbi:hypothetical protein RMCBS344292_09563 [Rhizopus microsporus]|nr:hypothetical protein RMCBS344292_09563 [Rhizopus microsporus]